MKLLLTGADGFTGRYIEHQAEERGYEVISLQSNLTDRDAVIDEVRRVAPEYVIHLAAISHVAHDDVADIYGVNLLGTRNLLEALSLSPKYLKAILLASSANVYGNTTREVVDESTPIVPANDYGISKMAMEAVARLWSDKLPIIVTRPFNYTGAGQSNQFLIPKIVEHFKQNTSAIQLGNLDVEREFGDVRVVAEIYCQLIETPAAIGETFNICSGLPYSLLEIITVMEKIAGYKIEIQINPDFVRPNEIKRLIGNNQFLHSVIGHKKYPEVEEILEWMYEA